MHRDLKKVFVLPKSRGRKCILSVTRELSAFDHRCSNCWNFYCKGNKIFPVYQLVFLKVNIFWRAHVVVVILDILYTQKNMQWITNWLNVQIWFNQISGFWEKLFSHFPIWSYKMSWEFWLTKKNKNFFDGHIRNIHTKEQFYRRWFLHLSQSEIIIGPSSHVEFLNEKKTMLKG